MRMFCVIDRFGDIICNPFTTRDLADKVLSIIKQADDLEARDEEAKILVMDPDPWATQLKAGLMPFKIGVELYPATGAVRDKKVELTWPPAEKEGLVEMSEVFLTYFVWARNKGEAITRMAQVANTRPAARQEGQDEEYESDLAYQASSARCRAQAGGW